MTILETKAEHAGTIRCTAENENGKAECDAPFTLTEERQPRAREEEGYPPRFNVPLWDRRIPAGQIMSVECHVDAKPLAEIKWTKVSKRNDTLTSPLLASMFCKLRDQIFNAHFQRNSKVAAIF